ncbi:S8 family serine peptidase [Rhodopila sp.]|uniref:S8 family serine peptidase n=1 Tax=Rhodopila sp. TaxID=2480087 RepID=UPI003D0DC97B
MAAFNSQDRAGGDTVDPGIVIAVVAALLDHKTARFAVMVSLRTAKNVPVPSFMTFGYGVDAANGEILPPPGEARSFAVNQPVFASARIDLTKVNDGSPAAKLDTVLRQLRQVTAEGWHLELTHKVMPQLDRSVPAMHASHQQLPSDLPFEGPLDGRDVLLGVVDFGCDFAHPAFRTQDGKTRLRMLWDQNATGAHGAGKPGLPGRFFSTQDVDNALRTADPYATLGYHPLSNKNLYTPSTALPGEPVHGTHVLGVAGGGATPGCPAGVAPGADLAFVQLQPGALVSDGDAVDVFDGVCSIFEHAAAREQPAVVNLSVGANAGPHDGSTIFDRAVDALLQAPGRAITVAAGNARQEHLHAMHVVIPNAPAILGWRFSEGSSAFNVARIFCGAEGGRPPVRCVIMDPDGRRIELGGATDNLLEIMTDPDKPRRTGIAYSGLATPLGDLPLQHIEIRLSPRTRSGEIWRIELSLGDAQTSQAALREITVHAWIERHDRRLHQQSTFVSNDTDFLEGCSLGSTACGYRTICVGAYDSTAADLPAAGFSSAGPTRDGRTKPDIAAPGINVRAAYAMGGCRSQKAQLIHRNPMRGRMSGTSVAAPHVAGVVALMLQANRHLGSDDILHALRSTTQLRPPTEALKSGTARYWLPQLGYGRVDAAAAVRWALEQAGTPDRALAGS